jgi:prophage tail gpP-like protein
VLVVSDGAGGILITRAGTPRARPARRGRQHQGGEIEYDATDRFYRYLVSSQPPGTDEASGEACACRREAIDADVRRTNRVLVIRPDKGMDAAGAPARGLGGADPRGEVGSGTITVQGLAAADGKLWPVNAITRVIAPRLIGIDGDMLISQVEYTVDDKAARSRQLTVVRPDAFTPEPQTAS